MKNNVINTNKKIKIIETDEIFEIQKTEFYKQFMEEFFENSKKYIKKAKTFDKNDITDKDYNRLYRFAQNIQKSSFAFLAAMEWTLICGYYSVTIRKNANFESKRKHYDLISNQTLGKLFEGILSIKSNDKQKLILKNLNKTKVFNEKIEIDDFKHKTITGFRNTIMHHKFLFGVSKHPDKKINTFIPSFFKDYINIFNSYEQTRHKLYILKNYSKWYGKPFDDISKYVFEICKKYFFLKDKIVLNFCENITKTKPGEFRKEILKKVDKLKVKKYKD